MNALPLRKLKHAAVLVAEKKPFELSDGSYVGLEHIRSWTGTIETQINTVPEGTVSLFKADDVLFGKLRPYLAKVTLAPFAGAASTEALILRARSDVWPSYLRYVLVEKGFIERVTASTFGAQMPRASWEFIGSQLIATPDLPTQRAIADFLDRETARIDKLIEKKEAFLSLIDEKKAALGTMAVDGALLDQDRDGAAGWFGKLPSKWPIRRAKFLFRERQDRSVTGSEELVLPRFGGQ